MTARKKSLKSRKSLKTVAVTGKQGGKVKGGLASIVKTMGEMRGIGGGNRSGL